MESKPKVKTKNVPKEMANIKSYLLEAVELSPISILPFVPDTHTAQFNKEIRDSIQLSWEVSPPPNEDYIDIGDKFKLKVTVQNNYEQRQSFWPPIQGLSPQGGFWPPTGPWTRFKIIPNVWFKKIILGVLPTGYIRLDGQTPSDWNYFTLISDPGRLKPGQTVTKEIGLTAVGCAPGADDPIETLVTIKLVASLDYEALFTYTLNDSIKAQIRNP